MWVAVGGGTYTIIYSSNGTSWTGASTSPFGTTSGTGYGVAWNGSMWLAGGTGGATMAYSSDGITWNTGTGSPFVTTTTPSVTGVGYGVAGNPNIGGPVIINQIVLNNSSSNKLDIVSDNYYNQGFTNFSVTIKSREL